MTQSVAPTRPPTTRKVRGGGYGPPGVPSGCAHANWAISVSKTDIFEGTRLGCGFMSHCSTSRMRPVAADVYVAWSGCVCVGHDPLDGAGRQYRSIAAGAAYQLSIDLLHAPALSSKRDWHHVDEWTRFNTAELFYKPRYV